MDRMNEKHRRFLVEVEIPADARDAKVFSVTMVTEDSFKFEAKVVSVLHGSSDFLWEAMDAAEDIARKAEDSFQSYRSLIDSYETPKAK